MINLSYTLTDERVYRCVAVTPTRKFEPAFTHPYDAELTTDTAAYRDWLLGQLNNQQTSTYKHAAALAQQHLSGSTIVLQLHQNAQHGDVLHAALLSLAATLTFKPSLPQPRTHGGLDLVEELIDEQETEIDPRRLVWITGHTGKVVLGYIWDTEGVLTALTADYGLIKLGRLDTTREINDELRTYPANFWAQRHLKQLTARVAVAPPTVIEEYEDQLIAMIARQRKAEQIDNPRNDLHNPDRYVDHQRGYWFSDDEPTDDPEPSYLEELHEREFSAFMNFHSALRTNVSAYIPREFNPEYARSVVKIAPNGDVSILNQARIARGITHLFTNASDLIAIVNIKSYKGDAPTTYIGRPMANREGSPLANPYKIGQEITRHLAQRLGDLTRTGKALSRTEAIKLQKLDLWHQMQSDTPQRRELIRLARQVKQGQKICLECWCKPEPCHGDTIKAAILYLLRTSQV